MDLVLGKRALLLIGSPMCTAFSRLQRWNLKRMDPKRRDRMIEEGRNHLHFCMLIYRVQNENGMYFLHGHPYSATSWDLPEVQEIRNMENVQVVKGDMCAFGMYQDAEEGRQLALKPTGFMTNAKELAKELEQDCDGTHTHVKLLNG